MNSDVTFEVEGEKIYVVIRIPVSFDFQKLLVEHKLKVDLPKVTKREREVAERIVHGDMNKEIADVLDLSERTVKFHVTSLLRKFNVRSRVELARVLSERDTPEAEISFNGTDKFLAEARSKKNVTVLPKKTVRA